MIKLKASKYSHYIEYKRGKKVGEGTYAVVYVGTAVLTDSEDLIAIKSIKPGLATEGLDYSAIREIKYLKELHHPNVINLIDVVTNPTDSDSPNNLNLVLEFLDADLEMVIKNNNVVFSSGDIKSWMLMLLRGLNYIHQRYVLHRDIKPNNLLLARDGVLKLADFGLARSYADPAPMTPTVVTRWYRSPELLYGASYYDGSMDIWAVGCVFAELMLRTPYFASESDIEQLKTIFQARGTPTEKDWPGMKQLPNYLEFEKFEGTPLRQLFTAAGNDALELLDSMLKYNPGKRPSAEHALEHAYFRNLPRPTKPSKLPRDVVVEEASNKRKPESELTGSHSKVARKLF